MSAERRTRSKWERDDDWRLDAEKLGMRATHLREELRAIEQEAARIAAAACLEDRLEAHLQDRPVSPDGRHHEMRICPITARDYPDFSNQVGCLLDAHPGAIGLDERQLPVIWATALRSVRAATGGQVTINLFYYVLPDPHLDSCMKDVRGH